MLGPIYAGTRASYIKADPTEDGARIDWCQMSIGLSRAVNQGSSLWMMLACLAAAAVLALRARKPAQAAHARRCRHPPASLRMQSSKCDP